MDAQDRQDGINGRVGEVIEASTSEFTAQCYKLYDAPAIGSLVICGDETPTYGIVCEAKTQSIDPGRAAIPRGMNAATEADVLSRNPQIERLLYTTLRAVIVGYQDSDEVRRYPPLNAPRMYAFVRVCEAGEVAEFSSSHEFLATLLNAPMNAQDHVVSSFLRYSSAAHLDPHEYLVHAGKSLASTLAGQFPRLSSILRSLE